MGKDTILIVEDEKINLTFIANHLKDLYDIKVAPNGQIALDIMYKFPIDLVLLDIQMPIMDGYETAQAITQDPKLSHIPFIFLTANSDSNSLIKGFEIGAKDYITKPFNPTELKVRVANHLLTHSMQIRLQQAYDNLKKFVDTQDNIVILTDVEEIHFANKKFFDFFGYKDLDEFSNSNGHRSICELLVPSQRYFHCAKVPADKNWLEYLQELPNSKRIVSVIDKDFAPHAFSLSISEFSDSLHIISFADISETMIEQVNLENKTTHDTLTNAFNREYFEANHLNIMKHFQKDGNKLALAMLDIDHFKEVNDTFGHDVGDLVLQHFVKTIKKYSRKDDILIRWGGEEFILLLQVGSKDDLDAILQKLRSHINEQNFPNVGHKSCSFGATLYEDTESIEKTIKRADQALYHAKNSGRDQVVIKLLGT